MRKRVAIGLSLAAVSGFVFAMWVLWNERPVDLAGANLRDFLR